MTLDESELSFLLRVLSQYVPKGPSETQLTLLLHDKIARKLHDGRGTS